LLEAASQIPSDVRERWLANSKLTDADRAAVTRVVGAALLAFQKVA
jgi:hypothetical protein